MKGTFKKPTVQSNPLDKDQDLEAWQGKTLDLDDKDKNYLNYLQKRFERAFNQMNSPQPEFNNKTFAQVYRENERLANTMLPATRYKGEVIVSAGTVEHKLHALLSNINNLNLSPDFFAFDEDNVEQSELAVALTDIVEETEELDKADGAGDQEKKIMRQLELLKQPVVYVQEEWRTEWAMRKTLKEKFTGQFKDFAGYTEKLVKVFDGPSRTILYSPNVFLGNIKKFHMDEQPYIFIRISQDYEDVKARFQKFDNFKYVLPGKVDHKDGVTPTITENNWRLADIADNEVEILMYQDPHRDEFQIVLNGVPMMPIGFPLSAVSPGGGYNVAKQVYRIINNHFAFGKSFIMSGSVKEISRLIDEQLKLSVLKTRKSYSPPYINTSGRVISPRVLDAGNISMGIPPDALQPIGQEGQGVTNGEVEMLRKFEDLLDKNTVSDVFTGQQPSGEVTATQILQTQKQAQLTLGLTIAVCASLEKKLAYLRLYNVLAHYFNPVGERVIGIGDARQLVKKYRSTNREKSIPNEGMGIRRVEVLDGELPSPENIREMERSYEEAKGKPIRITVVHTDIQHVRYTWYAVVNPREKESSPAYRAEFREMMADMAGLIALGSVPNVQALEEDFAKINQKQKSRLFNPPVNPGLGGISSMMQPPGAPPLAPEANPANSQINIPDAIPAV